MSDSTFNQNNNCLCDSNKTFEKCCGRFLNGSANAKTPKQLMRSRYTAYALGNHGEYLLATWLPEYVKEITAESLSEKTQQWVKLELLNNQQKANEGMVEFNAYYKNDDGSISVFHEESTFHRIDGRWYYVNGEVETNA